MTVRLMSDGELSRLEVLRDLDQWRLTAEAATQLLGLERREVFRLLKAYRTEGATGLISKRRGRPSNRRKPEELRDKALAIIREQYWDFGPTLAAEKLREGHGIALGRETLRLWMIGAGIWADRKQRRKHVHQPRHRGIVNASRPGIYAQSAPRHQAPSWMGFVPKNQVRTGLPGGGKEIRTLGPPLRRFTPSWCSRHCSRGGKRGIPILISHGRVRHRSQRHGWWISETGRCIVPGYDGDLRPDCLRASCFSSMRDRVVERPIRADHHGKMSSRPKGAATSSLSSSSSRTPMA